MWQAGARLGVSSHVGLPCLTDLAPSLWTKSTLNQTQPYDKALRALPLSGHGSSPLPSVVVWPPTHGPPRLPVVVGPPLPVVAGAPPTLRVCGGACVRICVWCRYTTDHLQLSSLGHGSGLLILHVVTGFCG